MPLNYTVQFPCQSVLAHSNLGWDAEDVGGASTLQFPSMEAADPRHPSEVYYEWIELYTKSRDTHANVPMPRVHRPRKPRPMIGWQMSPTDGVQAQQPAHSGIPSNHAFTQHREIPVSALARSVTGWRDAEDRGCASRMQFPTV